VLDLLPDVAEQRAQHVRLERRELLHSLIPRVLQNQTVEDWREPGTFECAVASMGKDSDASQRPEALASAQAGASRLTHGVALPVLQKEREDGGADG